MSKVGGHCHFTGKYIGAAYSIPLLKYIAAKEFSAVFHNGSNYEYRFIVKELVEEFEGQFTCLGENTEKYINFLVLIEKNLDKLIKEEKKS